MKGLRIIWCGLLLHAVRASAIAIAPGGTVSENFSIGTSATATLPSDWKADKNATVRTVGSYASAMTATEQRAGNSMSATAANGIYNYGAGAADTATDRAVGGISSGSGSQSVNVYVQLSNNGGAITNFTISYNVEKYRNGSNAAGFRMQLYSSTDGSTWTSAGTDFESAWAADADNNGFASAPGATQAVVNKSLPVVLAPGNTLYLAWNYSVRTGTTTTSAQGLGLDDVSITATGGGSGAALATNKVFLVTPTAQPALTTAPNVAVAFVTKSWSNGIAQIGYGTDISGSGWTWTNAAITNSVAGDYVATTNVAISAPGAYYYATRWTAAGVEYYATNAAGQINLASLVDGACYRWIVTNPSPADTSIASNMTIMAANTTSGSAQEYLGPGVRIFQALAPDIVCVQEFNVTDVTVRAFVNRVFGPQFQYICEPGVSIPNGIISRWPIIASGVWNAVDSVYPDRNYVWATLDIPGPTNLHAISVHISTDSAERPGEAIALTNYIRSSFNTNDYMVLAGDLNADSDTEPALTTLKTIFSDAQQPADAAGDKDTNEPRNQRYDFVLPNAPLNALHTTTTVAGVQFPHGIVLDTRTWGGTPPSPTQVDDSENGTGEHVNMQHMAIKKTFFGAPLTLPVPTNIVRLVYPTATVTATVTSVIEVFARNQTNGHGGAVAAQIGFGTSPNGNDWTWSAAGLTNLGLTGVLGVTNALVVPRPGTYYFAARWYGSGWTNYGWNSSGQTNATILAAQYLVVAFTRATNALTIWKFTNGVTTASNAGIFSLASGMTTNWVASAGMGADGDTVLCTDGYSTNDLARHVTFRKSTVGCQLIGFELRVRRGPTGPRTMLLQYTAQPGEGGWTSFDSVSLPAADAWYTYVFDCGQMTAMNNCADTGFRMIGTNAIGSELYVDAVKIAYGLPEPRLSALALVLLQSVARLRVHGRANSEH